MESLAGIAAVTVGGTGLVWWGSHLLEEASEKLARYYRLPPAVQGAVIAAVGSSMPEISSVIVSTLRHGAFDLGVAAIVGSAIFNILVIPGLSVLAGGPQRTSRELIYRDAQFYLVSVSVLLCAFSMSVIYYPVPGKPLVGSMTRGLALIPLVIYLLYIFIQHQDMVEDRAEGLVAETPTDISPGRQWARLVGGLVLILIGVEGLVHGAIACGELLGTPSFLWGLTVVAAGTSLPDAFVSIQAAKKEDGGVVALSNVLGSNIFDLLVAVPVGVMLAGTAAIDFAVAAPMMGALTLATVVFFAMLRTGREIGTIEAYLLLLGYALFVVWIVTETMGITSLLGGVSG